jgi:hypothetical protein
MVPQGRRATKRLIGWGVADTLSRLVARGSPFGEEFLLLMRTRFALSAGSFALLAVICSTLPAHAGPWSLAPGEYYSEFLAGWFSSDHYHDANGDKWPLAGGGLWEERSLLSYTELGWKKHLNFVLGIPAVSVTRQFGQAQQAVHPVPTATGLGDALVGFKWRLANGKTAAALELDWKPPLGYERSRFFAHADSAAAGDFNGDGDSLDVNRLNQLGSPVLGDGQNDVTVSLLLGTGIGSRVFVEGSGGYRYRFEEAFADQIVASADLGIWLTRSLMLGGRYLGELNAQKSDNPTRDPERHRAGPILVLRVDERLDVIASTLHTVNATNALHTDEVFVGVAFRQNKLDRLQGFLGGGTKP